MTPYALRLFSNNWDIKNVPFEVSSHGCSLYSGDETCHRCAQRGVLTHFCRRERTPHTCRHATGNLQSEQKHQITRTSGLLPSARLRDNACLHRRHVSVFLNKQADTRRCGQGLISRHLALENLTAIRFKCVFLYSKPGKWWSRVGLLTGISVNNLFSFSVLYFYFFGCGGRRLKLFMRTPFLSYLWLHFECHWFLRIDRIICTHHFAKEKRQLWMLGTFWGVFASF